MAFSTSPYPNIELSKLQKQYHVQSMQQEQEIAMQRQQIKHLMEEVHKPFDETEDFRDFVVWLCGVTEAKKPPSAEDWTNLRDKTKHIAAKFALRAKDQAAEHLKEKMQPDLFQQPFQDQYNKVLSQQLQTQMDKAAIEAMNMGTGVTYSSSTGAISK